MESIKDRDTKQEHPRPGHGRLIEAIQQEPQNCDRKNTARLREIFDEVEEALRGPYSHKKVIAALKKRGIEFELRSFESALYRIRRERKAQQPTRPQADQQADESDNSLTTTAAGSSSDDQEQEGGFFQNLANLTGEQGVASNNGNGFKKVVQQIKEQDAATDPRRTI